MTPVTLVTGATGHLGANLVRRLLSDGHRVRVLLRAGSVCDAVDGLQVERAIGDLRDPASLAAAVDGCARVFHCAARIAITIGACLLVFFITREVYKDDAVPPVENSTVLLEQVRKVMKLVTVEGDFNELYSREDSWNYSDWLARLPGFKKKIMLRVKARASVDL